MPAWDGFNLVFIFMLLKVNFRTRSSNLCFVHSPASMQISVFFSQCLKVTKLDRKELFPADVSIRDQEVYQQDLIPLPLLRLCDIYCKLFRQYKITYLYSSGSCSDLSSLWDEVSPAVARHNAIEANGEEPVHDTV